MTWLWLHDYCSFKNLNHLMYFSWGNFAITGVNELWLLCWFFSTCDWPCKSKCFVHFAGKMYSFISPRLWTWLYYPTVYITLQALKSKIQSSFLFCEQSLLTAVCAWVMTGRFLLKVTANAACHKNYLDWWKHLLHVCSLVEFRVFRVQRIIITCKCLCITCVF